MKLSESAILKLMHEKTNRPLKISELAKCLSIPDINKFFAGMKTRVKSFFVAGTAWQFPAEEIINIGGKHFYGEGFAQ